jgi:hypothetical protein
MPQQEQEHALKMCLAISIMQRMLILLSTLSSCCEESERESPVMSAA